MKTVNINEIILVINLVCFSTLSANSIHTSTNINLPTTTQPDGRIKCFKCTSWTNNYCTKRVGYSVALQYFPIVWCSGDCIMMVINHDGVTDVIRGCSTGGAEAKKTTCTKDYCNLNHGNTVSAVYTTLIMALLCSLAFIN